MSQLWYSDQSPPRRKESMAAARANLRLCPPSPPSPNKPLPSAPALPPWCCFPRQVVVATPDTLLGDILEHFAFYTGLPVVDARTLQCVGMITNIDIYKKQRGKAANVCQHVCQVRAAAALCWP